MRNTALHFVLFLLAAVCAYGQPSDTESENRIRQFASQGDYTEIAKLIDAQKSLWNTTPSVSYFKNMFSIGDILIGGTNAQLYWLGRKAMWNMLLKPVPSEYGAAQDVYLWKYTLFLLGAEAITPYVNSLSPELFASVRHDTFLMLTEYAKRLHATIIPGYHEKYSGAMNNWEERKRFKQNGIDNQVQVQARIAISSLATDHINYLINAYSHDPRDDDELKQLLDILNVQGADREKVMRDTR